MAPNKKGKQVKQTSNKKKQQQKSRHVSANPTPSASDPHPSVRAVPAGDVPASAPGPLAPLLAANPSPPPVATSSGPLSPPNPSPRPVATSSSPSSPPATSEPIQFATLYMEPSLEFQYEEEAEMSARLAVADAVSHATETFSSALGVLRMEFLVYLSFPTDFGGRDLTLREWNTLGKHPFVVLGPKDQSKGFQPLLKASRAEVEEVRQYNADLIDTGLQHLGLLPTPSAPCRGCKYLTNVVASLRSVNTLLDTKVELLDTKVEALTAEVASLLEEKERMRNVRRRILVIQAQEKAVRELGLTAADVHTWQSFFTEHGPKLRADFGVSKELLRLLLYGKGKLNKAVHRSGEYDLAEAVIAMRESSTKVQFEEAFLYVYGCSAVDAFEG